MPVYRFKLEDTESGEFRIVSVAAGSLEEAEEVIYRQEMKKVNFSLGEEDLANVTVVHKVSLNEKLTSEEEDRLVALAREGKAANAGIGNWKGTLHAHHQQEPYKIKKGKEAA